MESVLVKPAKQRGELVFVLSATIAIILCASLLIFLKNKGVTVQKLKWYQISAFSQLTSIEQGVFSDLYTSAFDIDIFHLENAEEWPDVKTLESNIIAPFTRDPVWKTRGRLLWTVAPMDDENVHRCLYVGETSDAAASGSFILFFEHFHTMDGAYFYGINKKEPFTIWHKSGAYKMPENVSEGTLVSSGWKEAIPYRGKDVLKKLDRTN